MNNKAIVKFLTLGGLIGIVLSFSGGGCILDQTGKLFEVVEQDAGTDSDSGTGGEAGVGGGASGGAGGEAGTTGTGGSIGGAGGEAGTGGATGGTGGTGGEAGSGGEAGAGGDGGGGGLTTCADAGDVGTVDNVSASGTTADGMLLHFNNVSPEVYSISHPAGETFNGQPMPGQMVVAGQDGVSFSLRNGATPIAKTWYKVTNLPSAQCAGIGGYQTEACLSVVAKSFRCQFAPYLETVDCPAVVINFSPQSPASTYSDAAVGWSIVLVDLTCN